MEGLADLANLGAPCARRSPAHARVIVRESCSRASLSLVASRTGYRDASRAGRGVSRERTVLSSNGRKGGGGGGQRAGRGEAAQGDGKERGRGQRVVCGVRVRVMVQVMRDEAARRLVEGWVAWACAVGVRGGRRLARGMASRGVARGARACSAQAAGHVPEGSTVRSAVGS